MFKTRLILAACGILSWLVGTACGADSWSGCHVMPKSDKLVLRAEVDGPAAGDAYQIEWPATVERVEGQWLRITDRGGYSVPAVAGWVSSDDVLRLDAAHDHYVAAAMAADAPWLHWLTGVCLQTRGETRSARREFLQSLRLPADAAAAAARAAVGANSRLLDAALRLAEMEAAEAKTVREAVDAADAIGELCETAARMGVRRPRLLFEHAEALRRAYRLKWSNKDDGVGDDPALFARADAAYGALISSDAGTPHADPGGWRGYLGRAELHLYRAAMFEKKASTLLAVGGAAPIVTEWAPNEAAPPAGAAAGVPSDDLDTIPSQINLKALDDFLRTLKTTAGGAKGNGGAKADPKSVEKATAAIDSLAAAVAAAGKSVGCFDEAVRRGPGIIEIYRDRGLAHLLTARCEAILGAIVDADPELKKHLQGLPNGSALSPEKLDRALVEGTRRFREAVEGLRAAGLDQSRIAERESDLRTVEGDLARKVLAPSTGRSDPGGKPPSEPAAAPGAADLAAVLAKIEQVRKQARQAEADLSKDQSAARDHLRAARETLRASYDALEQSGNLLRARESAHAACERGDYASVESLKLLALVYSSQCNFDRAEYYQKLAAIFASEDERPGVLATLDLYRKFGALVLAKAQAKTTGAPTPQGGRSGASSADGG